MKITPQGFAVIEGDSHIGKWSQEERRLDHNHSLRNRLEQIVPKGGVIVDAGAYIGDMTVYFSDWASMVYAFEPNEKAFECLIHNMRDKENVKCLFAALGETAGTCGIEEPNNNFGMARVKEGGSVPVLTLDSLNLQNVSFIKMDIEGFELFALQGAKKTIERCRPDLLLEINKGALHRFGITEHDVFDWLTNMGYSFENVYPEDKLDGIQFDVYCRCDEKYHENLLNGTD